MTPEQTAWEDFVTQLRGVTDRAKLDKGLAMLRAERFQLFADVQPDFVCGVVLAQSTDRRLYACRLAKDGRFFCCTQNLIMCVGSRRSVCKHLLVLVVGLVRTGQLPTATVLEWLRLSRRMSLTADGGKPNREQATETFFKYKGYELGEIDWRPTETIPEDFYAL
jgi:hypothetical protein